MTWKKLGGDKYIKFEAGKSIEGNYVKYERRDNPFEGESEYIYDYTIEIDGKEKVISSTSETLMQLIKLPAGTPVKIEMTQVGIKKRYNIYIDSDSTQQEE